jgi:hypothetical protein
MKHITDWNQVNHKDLDVEQVYEKSDLAKQQLRTAIWLYLNHIDFASAITLAGAAGNILHALVEQQGKQPMLEYSRLLCSKLVGRVPARDGYLKHFGNITGINHLKHMSASCPDTIEINLEDSAETAITRATIDFIKLYGENDPAIKSFWQRLWIVHDGENMMKQYEALPEEVKIK